MSLRMVPVSATFQKMHRIVRDMCKKLNKQARLTLVGEETEIDKTIVDSIGDPIMHIVRNSMDHGIEEDVQDRIRAGKDPLVRLLSPPGRPAARLSLRSGMTARASTMRPYCARPSKTGLPPPMWSTAP